MYNFIEIEEFYIKNVSELLSCNIDEVKKLLEEIMTINNKNVSNMNTLQVLKSIKDSIKDAIDNKFKNDKLNSKDFDNLLGLDQYFHIPNIYLNNMLEQNVNLIISNTNLLHLYFEYEFMNYFQKNAQNDKNTLIETFCYNNIYFMYESTTSTTDINTDLTNNPKNYIIFSRDLETLHKYNKLGCWTVYLTDFIFNTYYREPNHIINQETERNKNYIRKNGIFFDMSCENIIQLLYYIKIIHNINKQDKDKEKDNCKANRVALKEKIKELNPIKVFYLHQVHFKKKELTKIYHYFSNEKVLFVPYLGFDNLEEIELNNYLDKFDYILLKFANIQEYDHIKNLISSLNKYTKKMHNEIGFINSLKDIDNFYHRHLMSSYMNKFCDESINNSLNKINSQFNTSIKVPELNLVDLKDVQEEDKFFQFLDKNKLELPLIIKHSGPVEFCHLLVCIVSKRGISNYLSYVKEKAKPYNINEISLVVQNFVNHGGYFIKLFRVNGQSFPYVRPSLPDLSEDLEKTERFKNGFYSFITDDLLTKSYLDFW